MSVDGFGSVDRVGVDGSQLTRVGLLGVDVFMTAPNKLDRALGAPSKCVVAVVVDVAAAVSSQEDVCSESLDRLEDPPDIWMHLRRLTTGSMSHGSSLAGEHVVGRCKEAGRE